MIQATGKMTRKMDWPCLPLTIDRREKARRAEERGECISCGTIHVRGTIPQWFGKIFSLLSFTAATVTRPLKDFLIPASVHTCVGIALCSSPLSRRMRCRAEVWKTKRLRQFGNSGDSFQASLLLKLESESLRPRVFLFLGHFIYLLRSTGRRYMWALYTNTGALRIMINGIQ